MRKFGLIAITESFPKNIRQHSFRTFLKIEFVKLRSRPKLSHYCERCFTLLNRKYNVASVNKVIFEINKTPVEPKVAPVRVGVQNQRRSQLDN